MPIVLWIITGFIIWFWVQGVTISVPGPYWFPNTGIVVMGLITGIEGHVWDHYYDDNSVVRSLCVLAWIGGSIFGANYTYGPASVGEKVLNTLLIGTVGPLATWLIVRIMLRWRFHPLVQFGLIIGIGVSAFIPHIVIAIFLSKY